MLKKSGILSFASNLNENLKIFEGMSKWTRLFQQMCVQLNKQKTKEFEEKEIYRLVFGKKSREKQ